MAKVIVSKWWGQEMNPGRSEFRAGAGEKERRQEAGGLPGSPSQSLQVALRPSPTISAIHLCLSPHSQEDSPLECQAHCPPRGRGSGAWREVRSQDRKRATRWPLAPRSFLVPVGRAWG